MEEEGRLIINVGGTKFETTLSTIESKSETMISMLLRHHVDGKELFIDRSPRTFEWILHWYRTGILVDHTTVNVPSEVWDAELEFYLVKVDGLGDLEPKKRKLVEKAYEVKEQISETEKKKKDDRQMYYQRYISYMLDNMEGVRDKYFTFVSPGEKNQYPASYPNELKVLSLYFISYWFAEFQQECSELGMTAAKVAYNGDKIGWKYVEMPAKETDFRFKHEYLTIRLTMNKE
jgi:hypothetical protein